MLQFEHMFEKKQVSAIGAKVVDDTENFLVLVSLPEEGQAEIISITSPDTFTPGEEVKVRSWVKNIGATDYLFVKLIDMDTGNVLKEHTTSSPITAGAYWGWDMYITLTQDTDFHGQIKAGHIE